MARILAGNLQNVKKKVCFFVFCFFPLKSARNQLCNSRKYPYLPHGRDYLRPCHPSGNSNPLCGGSMDIFWMCTLCLKALLEMKLLLCKIGIVMITVIGNRTLYHPTQSVIILVISKLDSHFRRSILLSFV